MPYNRALTTMTKDERIGFRVSRELKKSLLQIASREGRSIAQVGKILLRGGIAAYKKAGGKYPERFLSRQ